VLNLNAKMKIFRFAERQDVFEQKLSGIMGKMNQAFAV
jgi:hypothetical protein